MGRWQWWWRQDVMCGWSFFSLRLVEDSDVGYSVTQGRDMHPWCPKDQRQNCYSLPSSIILTISTNAHWLTTCRSIEHHWKEERSVRQRKHVYLKNSGVWGMDFLLSSHLIFCAPFLGLHLVLFKGLHFVSIFFRRKILMAYCDFRRKLHKQTI